MLPEFKDGHNALNHAMALQGLDSRYIVKKLMMETSLYSIYFVSAKEQPMANDQVLLVEHPPAKEPSAHLLPITISESVTMSKTAKEVVEAVHAHFAQED